MVGLKINVAKVHENVCQHIDDASPQVNNAEDGQQQIMCTLTPNLVTPSATAQLLVRSTGAEKKEPSTKSSLTGFEMMYPLYTRPV